MTFRILVLCTHNSARSILAEAMLNHFAARRGRDVSACSAGSSPSGRVHPLALRALENAGIGTAGLHSKSWSQFAGDRAPPLDLVITVCDAAAAEHCPVFGGDSGRTPLRVHWPIADPSFGAGDDEAKTRQFDLTRQALGYRILQLLALPLETLRDHALEAALLEIGRN